MIENTFHRNLILPFDMKAYQYPNTPGTLSLRNNSIDFSEIEPIFFEWLNDHGLSCCSRWSRYFNSKPHAKYNIHADSIRSTDPKTKLNIIFDSYGTIMKWYELKDRYKKVPEKYFVNNVIRIYKEPQCIEVFQTNTDSHCLIDGAKIHTLINSANQNKMRKCLSFALKSLKTNQLISFDEAAELLRI